MIKVQNLEFYYDYKLPTEMHALKDINLEVARGEYVVFFGPSGCGKTTLVYIIGGITTGVNGTGKVIVNESDIINSSNEDLAIFRQTGIGIIFQNFNLIQSLTVLDNVALPMTFIGISKEERANNSFELLKRLGMEKYADRYPSELSGGQQQRVGIARALANNPPIIIADEPLGNLDSENAELVLNFLKELQEKDGRTVIMVTHEAWSVRDAQKIVYLKDGAVIKTTGAIKRTDASSISSDVYGEMYQNKTTDEITSKTLSNLLLRGFSSKEIERLESFLSDRLTNKIDAETFRKNIDLPFHSGGVGLWKQRAEKISKLIEDMISERTKLHTIYEELEKNHSTPVTEEVESLQLFALSEYSGHVKPIQRLRLQRTLTDRLRGTISAKTFKDTLGLSRSKGGIGFSIRTTQHISDKIETVLSLGHTQNIDDIAANISSIT